MIKGEYTFTNKCFGGYMEIYVVKDGDTVESVAAAFSVDAQTLATDNQILYPYRLAAGQALLIPNGLGTRNAVLRSSGYAYPFIDVDVLFLHLNVYLVL